MITAKQIKTLRDRTGISVLQCRTALEEAGGDQAKALEILKKKSVEIAAKKSGRTLEAGAVGVYAHATGALGAMAELLCETDFVAKNDLFRETAREIAMHVAAMAPGSAEELLAQESFKRPGQSIGQIVTELAQKLGERVEMGRFERFAVKG